MDSYCSERGGGPASFIRPADVARAQGGAGPIADRSAEICLNQHGLDTRKSAIRQPRPFGGRDLLHDHHGLHSACVGTTTQDHGSTGPDVEGVTARGYE